MSKPDWKDAPEWAMYMAQDSEISGSSWTWFEVEPYMQGDYWMQPDGSKCCYALPGKDNAKWKKSLERRP